MPTHAKSGAAPIIAPISKARGMDQYSFTVEITGLSNQGSYDDILYEAGCSDALVVVVDGRMMMDFDRLAASYERAVESVISDLTKAGAKIVNITPIEG
jgi:hypothetical protein